MSPRLAAPGVQVSQGRLRVDAARAITKLREYQLVDRAAWVLEGVRAAVAAGATRIVVRGDANDIWLSWSGPALETELLPRLFDELVSPEVSDSKQHVRLLAAAVNSALGLDPAYVDVYSITEQGSAQRARYTPDVLAEPENELGEAPLRHVEVETREPPTEISSGVLVHLRRKASLQVLSYFFGEPPELPLARRACRNVPVPLDLGGDDLVVHRALHDDLVRIPLGEGLDGFVAITRENVEPNACFEVAERGVVLARYDLEVLGFQTKTPVPIRVFLDAQRLPTNASRSQVRRDVHPITTAERRAKQLIGEAIAKLAELFGDGTSATAPQARKAAFALLASNVGGHPVGWRHLSSVFAPFAKLPLVRNCFGEPRTVSTSWVSNIHTEQTPLDADLKPWVEEILWAPPYDDVRILLAGYMIDVAGMRRFARWARQQRRAHKRFLAHRKREIKVQTSVYPRARVSLGVMVEGSCVPQELFHGIHGEICIYTEMRDASVVMCVEGRELERVEHPSAIAFDAVLDSKRLTPGERYRGVRRDDGYSAVDTALRGGVVRAVETLAAESDKVLDVDMPLIRSALVLARDVGFPLTGPLVHAKVFRTAAGGYVSHAELAIEKYVGVVGDAEAIVPPPGRMIVRASGPAREELRRMLGSKVISYHKAVDSKRLEPKQLAERLQRNRGTACTSFRAAGMTVAITLSTVPRLYLYHCGIGVEERPRRFAMLPSDIAVEADGIVPNDKWSGVLETAGIPELVTRDWEAELIRAVVMKLIGEDVPGWVGPDVVTVEDANFEAVEVVLTLNDPLVILGKDLADRLCEWPLFVRMGETSPVSIRQLADENPQGIFYVPREENDPVAGFKPVVASAKTARLIGMLARRPVHDGKPELQRLKKVALRKARIDEHLAKPEEPCALASDMPTIHFGGKTVTGFLAVSTAQPEVRVYTENRPFKTLWPAVGYPVVAAVELALSECGDTFEGISNLTLEAILDDVRAQIPALLEVLARQAPHLLGDPGPARRLLAQFLQSGQITPELREVMRTTKAFATVQGDRRSIVELEDPPTYMPVAAFGDEWLPPGEGENPTPLDGPLLRVSNPPDELDAIIGKLHMDQVTYLTTEVTRLQARRRMARGLMPAPKLHGLPDELKRPLKDFPDISRKLGHGEVGLALGPAAMLFIHERGRYQRTHEIDVMPAIHLAIETPHETLDHAQMTRLAQDLAIELVRVALPAHVPESIRANLARGVLSRRLPPAAVGSVPLFQLIDGTWLDWKGFQAQLDKYMDVWAITPTVTASLPLDPERKVIILHPADIELAEKNGYQVINAKLELEQDALARAKMKRPKAPDLALPTSNGVLASVELDGNGRTGPRGVVAVLSPQSAGRRGVYAHRDMHPFDRVNDVCRWPTQAIVDDARIVPDRTWSAPKGDEVWAAITKQIRLASEHALEQLGTIPGDALTDIRITNHVCSDVKALREAPRSVIRGVLWLTAVPYALVSIKVHHGTGVRSFVPQHGLAIGGELAVFSEDDLDLTAALEQLAGVCHSKLVRKLLKDDDADPDVVAAHVAHAIALNTVKPTEVKGIEFSCFAPAALEPRQLASLFRNTYSVPTVKPGATDIAETAFADDGSELAKVVRVHLGERLTKYAPPPKPKPSPPPPPVKPPVSTERPAMIREVKKPPPPKPHELQPLVDALIARVSRLGVVAYGWQIHDTSEPAITHDQSGIVLGGHNTRLKRIAAELLADTIRAAPAVDALAAHIVSVLNIARSDITDASEMHALGVLLSTPPSATPPRSRRSS